MRILIALVLSVVVASGLAAQSRYLIKPGDTLDISVLEDANLNTQALVLPDGRVSVPLAGSVGVSGLTVDQARSRVVSALASNFAVEPTVSVSLASLGDPLPVVGRAGPRTIDVFVVGEVQNAGAIEAPRGTNILQMLAIAGGPTRFAATKRIQLRRTDPKTGAQSLFTFNYRAIQNGASVGAIATLQDGDVIIVPERRLFE